MRQYSDILFLSGQFSRSLNILKKLEKRTSSELELLETQRIIGHIFRFNFNLSEANKIYKGILSQAKSSNFFVLESKILTNLTEANCFFSPDIAIEFGLSSIKNNSELNSLIEMGKTESALSIAYLMKRDITRSIYYANHSLELQLRSGYSSGILFSHLSLFFIHLYQNHKNEQAEQESLISYMLKNIQVYQYLFLPIALYRKDSSKIIQIKNQCQWLDFSTVLLDNKQIIKQLVQ